MFLKMIIGIIAGLGIFIFGMNLMGAGLQKIAGNNIKKIITALTKNRLVAVFIGAAVTMIIQSSSATTVMLVGLVNSGVMKLSQSVGLIMGANIGTTITGQLISFKLEVFAPVFVGIGLVLSLTGKKTKQQNLAEMLIGFGLLFVGMNYLKDALSPLRDMPQFKDILISFGSNPLLGIFMGFLLTFSVQSSSASIGMLIALASQGLLPIESALPILYGDNIGTCTTALLSSIGTSKNAQRVAIIHLTFNVIGTLLFAFILNPFIVAMVTRINPSNIQRQIANAHTLFNTANVIIQFPVAGWLVRFSERMIPLSDEEQVMTSTKYIDDRMITTPVIAISNVILECNYMGETAYDSLQHAIQSIYESNSQQAYQTYNLEKKINNLQTDLISFLVKLSNADLSIDQRNVVYRLFHIVSDIERIGDHAENIADLAIDYNQKDFVFSQDALDDLSTFSQKVDLSIEHALNSLKTGNEVMAQYVLELEQEIDQLTVSLKDRHIGRLNTMICDAEEAVIFSDILTNLERVSDHAKKIAYLVLDVDKKMLS